MRLTVFVKLHIITMSSADHLVLHGDGSTLELHNIHLAPERVIVPVIDLTGRQLDRILTVSTEHRIPECIDCQYGIGASLRPTLRGVHV